MINIRLHEKNINTLKFELPQDIDVFYFDSLMACNIKCVYCHHPRESSPMSELDFKRFLETQVKSINSFSLGCAMEPTMDKRMVNFARIVSESKLKLKQFKLQTNGSILHKHDTQALKDYGMDSICFSFDSNDPEIHKIQRGGSDLNQIISNIRMIRKSWNKAHVALMATVTRLSSKKLEELVKFSIGEGANGLTLRNLYYYPNNEMIDDHEWMSSMVMTEEEFLNIVNPIVDQYKSKINFIVMTHKIVKSNNEKILV